MTAQQHASEAQPRQTEAPKTSDTPAIGTVVETFHHGRQQVMDVMGPPFPEQTVYLRPERGGREWTVPVSGLARVVKPTDVTGA